jgi:hypothetical protein
MKNSELRKLVSQYKEIKKQLIKKHTNNFKLVEKLKEIEHKYFHETGRRLSLDLKEYKEN